MWLILTDGDPELCRTDGDYDIDVYVTTSTETLAGWWLGELDWSAAEESGAAQITGLYGLSRAFSSWFLGYALAPTQPISE